MKICIACYNKNVRSLLLRAHVAVGTIRVAVPHLDEDRDVYMHNRTLRALDVNETMY